MTLPFDILAAIAEFHDANCFLTSPTLNNLMIAMRQPSDELPVVIANRWLRFQGSLHVSHTFRLPPTSVSQILVRRPCRTTQMLLIVKYEVDHPQLRLLRLLDELAMKEWVKRYPRIAVHTLDTKELELKMPRFTQGDLQCGDLASGYQYVSVPAILDCRDYYKQIPLAVGDVIQPRVVLTGWMHNKHQRRAICLRADGW